MEYNIFKQNETRNALRVLNRLWYFITLTLVVLQKLFERVIDTQYIILGV